MKKLAAALALSLGLVALAPAASLDFTYDFDGIALTGTLLGTLEANGDTFDVTGLSSLSWNGATWTNLPASYVHSSSTFPSYGPQPTVSLSGLASGMDIFVCSQGFDVDGNNCSFANSGGFYLQSTDGGVGDGQGKAVWVGYSASNWQASLTSAVPEAPVWLMLALGAIVVRTGTQRRRQALA
jgi:hypothetical protein